LPSWRLQFPRRCRRYLDFGNDGSSRRSKATEHRAILTSYESAKKAKADARSHEEADEEQFSRALDISVQQAPIE
jgi:hypothetical protein